MADERDAADVDVWWTNEAEIGVPILGVGEGGIADVEHVRLPSH